MSGEQLLAQYGPWLGLFIYFAITLLPPISAFVKALGIGQVAKATASAEVVNAQAEATRAEADTQRGMTTIAMKMVEQQQEFHARHNSLNTDFGELKVKFAEMSGEYRAYREGQAEVVASLKQQISITEDLRHGEQRHNERLQDELRDLRDQVGKMQLALDAVNSISEERKKEIEQLRATNAELEEKNSASQRRIEELEAQIKTMEIEKNELRRRIDQLEQKSREETVAIPLP